MKDNMENKKDTNKRQLVGEVLDSLMDRTAVIKVERRFPHPVYKKFVTKSKNITRMTQRISVILVIQ